MDGHSRQDEIRARLTDITGPDPGRPERALLSQLIRNFQARTPGRVDLLGELLRGGTPGEVRDHAHTMKGSASNLGAGTLAALFAEVEHTAGTGVVPDPDLTLARLGAELSQVRAVLDAVAAELDQ
jgi:histidine phosphotransfer protein HptB